MGLDDGPRVAAAPPWKVHTVSRNSDKLSEKSDSLKERVNE